MKLLESYGVCILKKSEEIHDEMLQKYGRTISSYGLTEIAKGKGKVSGARERR